MADISHYGPNGESFTTRLDNVGYSWGVAGENVAWMGGSAQAVHQAWMNSPGHRTNIMNPAVTQLGIWRTIDDGRYGVMWYYW